MQERPQRRRRLAGAGAPHFESPLGNVRRVRMPVSWATLGHHPLAMQTPSRQRHPVTTRISPFTPPIRALKAEPIPGNLPVRD
jgi:hypothetical protein